MAPPADEPVRDERADHDLVADAVAELLCRVGEQDVEAFELLYQRFVRPVYGLARRRLVGGEGAEDATRRTFAAVWRSAATFVPGRDDGVRWLWTIADNVIAGRESRRPRPVAPDELPEVTLRESGRTSALDDGWLAFRVHAAVAELPEQDRVPLELAYWGGYSQIEVAVQLGLPLGTVKTRMRGVLGRLTTRLEDLR
jgi:RNA polymerase sigma-70 factor (ECF subfamily)